jgi:hypothetical protein
VSSPASDSPAESKTASETSQPVSTDQSSTNEAFVKSADGLDKQTQTQTDGNHVSGTSVESDRSKEGTIESRSADTADHDLIMSLEKRLSDLEDRLSNTLPQSSPQIADTGAQNSAATRGSTRGPADSQRGGPEEGNSAEITHSINAQSSQESYWNTGGAEGGRGRGGNAAASPEDHQGVADDLGIPAVLRK